MKWKQYKRPNIGDERIITKFLWFPRTIMEETRWLEVASFRQRARCCETDCLDYEDGGCYCNRYWLDSAWTN